MSKIISFVFMFLVLVLGLGFFTLNDHSVALNYYFGSSELSLPIILIVAVTLGAVLGLIGSMRPILKLRKEIALLKRSNQSIAREVSHVKATIKDSH